jgi:hypothetical protein
MSLSYIDDLASAFNNLSQIDDYTSFPKCNNCLDESNKTNNIFNFGVYTMNITIKQINKYQVGYKTKDDTEQKVKIDYCRKCLELDDKFVTECDCPKPIRKDQFENDYCLLELYNPIKFDLYFGFYCDTPIEFDIYMSGHFPYHYVLEPGKFTPFYTEKGNNIVLVPLNKHKLFEIRDIKSETNQFNLSYLGAYLNFDLLTETKNKCMTNFRLFPK